jgi:hypothetical protein
MSSGVPSATGFPHTDSGHPEIPQAGGDDMTTPSEPDPEGHNAAEDLDEDRLRLDPLEEGMDPPEHWSPAMEHGTTARETREGESLDDRLREEQPDTELPPEPPRDELDRMDAEGELSGNPTDEDGEIAFARDYDRPQEGNGGPPADEDAQSVARELRTPRERAR